MSCWSETQSFIKFHLFAHEIFLQTQIFILTAFIFLLKILMLSMNFPYKLDLSIVGCIFVFLFLFIVKSTIFNHAEMESFLIMSL